MIYLVIKTDCNFLTLPSKKIIPVIIACIVAGGTITYAATFNNNDVHAQQTAAHLLVDTSKTTIPVSDDVWQNTLATVEPGSQQLVITATTTPTVPLNSTQLMAHNLISSYLSLKQQNNGTLSDADQQDLAQQIVTNSAYNQLSTASSTSYFSNDIKITTDDNDAAVRAYGNAVATA
ncbi:MAG TPA: hypothetical protein VGT41_00575, partial [Candidatus Babeliales bacterium]|nr:hypothetical protein [Candidatus Babeliales bacterium]